MFDKKPCWYCIITVQTLVGVLVDNCVKEKSEQQAEFCDECYLYIYLPWVYSHEEVIFSNNLIYLGFDHVY